MTTLIGPQHAEAANYLRRVYDASEANRARVDDLLAMPEAYRNLVLLELAELSPGLFVRAMTTVAELGCLGCGHGRHDAQECLAALTTADGDPSWCLCGVTDRG